MKLLITGCVGFIGINFTKYWLRNYPQDVIIGVDCLTYAANISALKSLQQRTNFKFYKTNICDQEEIEKIFEYERPDVVVNFAAESHVDRSIESARIFIETNVLGTQTLLDACLKYDVKRFHQISTDEVYGDLPINSKRAFHENSPLRPNSPYSASKAAADLLVLSYAKTHNLYVTISRSANNYGKYQHEEKLIPKTIRRALRGECIPVYGNGLNVRDWIHVEDHCRAVDFILRGGKSGNIYNVGGGYSVANIVLVKNILQQLGKNEETIAYVTDRKGHDRKYALNCNKLIAELGWKAQVDFLDGLKQTILWFQK